MKKEWSRRLLGVQKILFIVVLIAGLGISVGYAADDTLLMATTTSTDNTGLLDYLMSSFTNATGIDIKWIATGTGKALKHGEN